MALDTWGMTPKSQTDPETIEQAIERLIAVHEADPEAHMGDGESIDIHRTNTVLDHPEQSVVADKITRENVILDTNFSSLDNLATSGNVLVGNLDGAVLNVASPSPGNSNIAIEGSYFSNLIDVSVDMYWETKVLFSEDVSFNATIGLVSSYLTTATGWGFQIRSGVLYAYCGNSTSHSELQILGVDLQTSHFYSAKYDHVNNQVLFYVDGTLVATLTATGKSSWYSDTSYIVKLTLISTNEQNMAVKYFYFCHNPIN